MDIEGSAERLEELKKPSRKKGCWVSRPVTGLGMNELKREFLGLVEPGVPVGG